MNLACHLTRKREELETSLTKETERAGETEHVLAQIFLTHLKENWEKSKTISVDILAKAMDCVSKSTERMTVAVRDEAGCVTLITAMNRSCVTNL